MNLFFRKASIFFITVFSISSIILAEPSEGKKKRSTFVQNQTYRNLLGHFAETIQQAEYKDIFNLLLNDDDKTELKTKAQTEIDKKYKKKSIAEEEKQKELATKTHETLDVACGYQVKKLGDLHVMFADCPFFEEEKVRRVKIEINTFDDGRFFKGDAKRPFVNIFQIFFQPRARTALTKAGYLTAEWELANPLAEAEDIIKRQDRVKKLLSDQEKFDEIDEALKKIAEIEENWLDLKYRKERSNSGTTFDKNDWIWKSSFDDYQDFIRRTGGREDDAALAYLIYKLTSFFLSGPANNTDLGMLFINVIIPKLFWGGLSLSSFLWSTACFYRAYHETGVHKIFPILGGTFAAFLGFIFLKVIRYTMAQIFDAQRQLRKMRQLKDNMEQLCTLLDKEFLPSMDELERFLDSETSDEELNSLLKKIDSTTFSGSNSWFSHHGRTIRTFIALDELKEKFVTAMKVVGQIDFHMAIAKLYKYSQTSKNPFSFPEVIDSQDTLFELQKIWSPIIGQDIAVPSDICLGVASLNKKIGAVVSGPNYGGKSVYLMEILTACAVIQSLGIGPCKSGRISPIDKIETYVTVKDNPPEESLFSAQCGRLNTFIKSAATAERENTKKLVLIDEPLTGTKVLYAEELVNSIIEELSKYNKSIYVLTTHFDAVIDGLEENSGGRFENRQVLANVDKDGIFLSPRFEVGPGKSRVDAALKVAQNRFDRENQHVVDNARARILNRINRMKAI